MANVEPGACSVDVTADSAHEFLSLLDPLQGMFTSRRYIFRGVSSDTYGLLPSAHRRGARLLVSEKHTGYGPFEHIGDQCAAEFWTLKKFFTILTRHGLRIPEDSYILRDHLDAWCVRFARHSLTGCTWPSPELYSLIALAQHYGVPTRALDWTWSAFTAAYFAAKPAIVAAKEDYIGVWAVEDFSTPLESARFAESDAPLRIFSVSGADNVNLRAQRGLFMLSPEVIPDFWWCETFLGQSHDEILNVVDGRTRFVRVRVATTEAFRVLALLARVEVTAGALFPGLWGAAREYDEDFDIKADNLPIPDHRVWEQVRSASDQVRRLTSR